MNDRTEHYRFLKDIFPSAGPELLRLLQGAAENASLLRSDFYTMRDWLEIAAYGEDEPAYAILLLMLTALEEGSLCIELAEAPLARRLGDFVPEEQAIGWARRIMKSLTPLEYPALIGAAPSDPMPVILHTIGSQRFLYFQRYLRAELAFHGDLMQRLKQGLPVLRSWTDIVATVTANQPFRLDVDQRSALDAALGNNLTVISGGPGTGKTSIVLTLLRCLVRGGVAPERIGLAAPTGRAAQRLTDALRAGLERIGADPSSQDGVLREVKATTLHQLLRYNPARNLFTRHRENLIPADVVIVDEVSMVGMVLMAQLFQALAPETKLILLGDKDQLPSVDAGAVLAHLAPGTDGRSILGERVVVLRTNHRSEQAIRVAADAINSQDTSIVERLPTLRLQAEVNLDTESGCRLLEQTAGTSHELRGFLQAWADQAYFRSKVNGRCLAELIEAGDDGRLGLEALFTLLDRYRLLTLVHDSAWGCDEINEAFRNYLRPKLDTQARTGLFAGAPVLITRNDGAQGLFNGDLGITVRTANGLRVLFPRHDGAASFPVDGLPAHELGFALTVHKSQGSEYANVMLVVPPKGGKRLLTKELIYTAITRARSLALICSSKETLKLAIGRRIVRESGVLRF